MDHNTDPIVVFTQYTFQQMREFQCHVFRKIRKIFYIMAAMFLLYIIQIVAQGAETSALFQMLSDGTVSIVAVLVPFFFVSFLGITSFGLLYTKKKHEETTLHQKNGQTCTFRSNDYEVETNSPGAEGKMLYSYDSIKRAEETKDMFYLFTGKNAATLVDKQGFKSGSHEDFRLILKRHVPPSKCLLL